jgi:hypothetical protein
VTREFFSRANAGEESRESRERAREVPSFVAREADSSSVSDIGDRDERSVAVSTSRRSRRTSIVNVSICASFAATERAVAASRATRFSSSASRSDAARAVASRAASRFQSPRRLFVAIPPRVAKTPRLF